MNPTQTTKSRPPALPSLSSLFKSTMKKNALAGEDSAFEQVHPHSSRANLKTAERLDISPEMQTQDDRVMTQESQNPSKKKKNVVFNEECEYLKTPPMKAENREVTRVNEKPAKKGILVRKRLYSDHGIPVNKDSTAETSQISNASVLYTEEKTKEVSKETTKEEKRPPSSGQFNIGTEFPGLISSFAEAFDRPRSDSVDKIRHHLPSTPDILDQTAAFKNLTGRSGPSIFKPAFTKNDALTLFKGSPKNEEAKIFSDVKSQSIKSSFFSSVKDKETNNNGSTIFNLKEGTTPSFNVSTVKKEDALTKLLAQGPNSNEPRTAKEIYAQMKAERNEYEKLQKTMETPFDSLSIKHKKSNSLSESGRSNFALAANSILKTDQFQLPHITPFSQKPTLISSFQASTPNPQYIGTPKKV